MQVSIYHPEFWIKHGHSGYGYCAKGRPGTLKNFNFRVNYPSYDNDFVVVHDDLDQDMKLKARSGGFILVTGEEKSIKTYSPEFINQFDLVITSRDDVVHPQVIRTHYLHPWWVKKTYDELVALTPPVKKKNLSAIVSNLTILPSHKDRFALINKLKGHYKDELDWFSKGEQTFLLDKWDGLLSYKYSIAIENSHHMNYFTEKISDCFLSYTMPFYSGCLNIHEFFDERSFILIETKDFIKSIEIIDDAIANNLHIKNAGFLQESRLLVLQKYNFIAALTNIIQKLPKLESRVVKTLHPQLYFNHGQIERLIRRSISKIRGTRF